MTNGNFYNASKKERYLQEELGYLNDEQKLSQVYVFSQIAEIEGLLKKDIAEFNLQELINLFEQLNWIHSTTFKVRKSILKKYFEWYHKQSAKVLSIGMLRFDDLTGEANFRKKYFKDLEDLKNCLNYVYDNADEYDTSKFDMNKAVWYLTWYRFTKEEIAALKKDDVDSLTKTIKSSISDYKVENVDSEVINLLEKIKYAESYFIIVGYNSVAQNYYSMTDYLIRTRAAKDEDSNDIVNIKNFLRGAGKKWKELVENLSPFEEYYGKKISYSLIYDSGVYNKLYNLECKGVDIKINNYSVINEVARINNDKDAFNNNGRSIYNSYLKWKKFYFDK